MLMHNISYDPCIYCFPRKLCVIVSVYVAECYNEVFHYLRLSCHNNFH